MNTKVGLTNRKARIFSTGKLTSDIWIRTMKGQFHLAFWPETIRGDFFDVPDNVGSNGIGFLQISPKGKCGTAREGSDNFWDLCLWYLCLLLGLLNPLPIFHVILTLFSATNRQLGFQYRYYIADIISENYFHSCRMYFLRFPPKLNLCIPKSWRVMFDHLNPSFTQNWPQPLFHLELEFLFYR